MRVLFAPEGEQRPLAVAKADHADAYEQLCFGRGRARGSCNFEKTHLMAPGKASPRGRSFSGFMMISGLTRPEL